MVDEIGASIFIPKDAVIEEEQVNLAAGFSDAYEIPEDVESVSPAYVFRTHRELRFRKEVDVVLQHTAHLETEEDCQDMVVLKADLSASKDSLSSNPTHKFVESTETKIECKPGKNRFGVIKLKRLVSSVIKIGRKSKKSPNSKKEDQSFTGILKF